MMMRVASTTAVVVLWLLAVSLCDVKSAEFLRRHGTVPLVFLTNLLGIVFSALLGSGCSMPPLFFTCRCLHALRLGSTTMMWRSDGALIIGLALCNTCALLSMFFAFELAGMSTAYSFKSTEPLMTCVLSLSCVQKVLWANNNDAHRVPQPSWSQWLAVTCVVLGAAMCSSSIHRSGVTSASDVRSATALVLISNFLLALRTVLQKHLITKHRGAWGESNIARRLFLDVSAIGAVVLLPVVVVDGWWHREATVDVTLDDVQRIVLASLGYSVYQAANSTILFHISPVAYGVAKQMRIVLLFLFSSMYFGESMDKALGALGIVTGVAGGSWFAFLDRRAPKASVSIEYM